MNISSPFPLEGKIEKILSHQPVSQDWQPTGQTKDLYVELSEPIVRQAVPWQDEVGRIIDPYEPGSDVNFGPKGFAPFTTSRFVGALGFLISVGRSLDLVDICVKSMDITCKDLFNSHATPVRGVMFYAKELMRGYLALKDKVDKKTVKRWEDLLGGYDLDKTYAYVPYYFKEQPKWRKRDYLANCLTFALAGEGFKKKYGIADNSDWIDKYLEYQLDNFTEFGMYCEPMNPMTYEWTPRMNLSLLSYTGYNGEFVKELDETLRRGALTMLMYLSSTGEAPYGGRSNQQNFNEATIALICEFEAIRYKNSGDLEMAGAFKRAARLATLAIKRWLDLSPVRYTKNEFPPETQHGRQSDYGYYGIYSLLIASQLGFAHLIADDIIEEKPAPCEVGGYILDIPEAFHKIFATCQGYHLEIDTRADHHYDATGLGRLHYSSIPTEMALSTSIVPSPSYLASVPFSPRSIAIGPGWENADGDIYWLADYSDEIEKVEVEDLNEAKQEIQFKVVYTGKFKSCNTVIESYKLNSKGLEIENRVLGEVDNILVQVPLIATDGGNNSEIKVDKNAFNVQYIKRLYKIEPIYPKGKAVETFIESFLAPNKNGIYKVGCFKTKGNHIKYRLSLNEK